MPVLRECERCGKEFSLPPSRIKEGKGRFCSIECRIQPGKALACATCGKEFYALHHELEKGRKYCSRECHYRSHGREIYPNGDGTATIELTQGYRAIIDEEDLPLVDGKSWQAWKHRRTVYAATGCGEDKALLHTLIIDCPPGMVRDHIDGDGLNNRRSNLRACTNGENLRNTYRHRARS